MMQRRLSTIMAADVSGYSARMQRAETDTIARLSRLAELIERRAGAAGGRVFGRAGDGFLAEFASPVAAVRMAFDLQRELSLPESVGEIGLDLRIGLHLADVVVVGNDLLGDGVNVASRIEGEAQPGSVLVSRTVFEHVKHVAGLRFEPEGRRALKNLAEPVEVFRISGELGGHSYVTSIPTDEALRGAAEPARHAHSLVVLPFKTQGTDASHEYLADGFTDDLITELSRFRDVFTISRNTSFGLRGTTLALADLSRKLGVQYCLEGGLRLFGDRLRINCFLVDAESGEQLWAEKSDCTRDEVFDLQDDLIAKIVSSVTGQMARQAEASARRKRPTDLAAFDCLNRGLEFHRLGGVTQQNAELALYWFEQAVAKDPTYGRAHAWRACALATVAEWTGEDVLSDLEDIGRKAIEYDDTDAESHRIAGSLAIYKRDFERAHYHFDRALRLNPNHAYMIGRMGEYYNFIGDGRTALQFQRRARQLDPFLPEYCRELEAVAHYVLEEYDECLAAVGQFARLTRRAAAYGAAAAVHLDEDRLAAAARALLLIDPSFDPETFLQAECYRDRAMIDRLRKDLGKVAAKLTQPPASVVPIRRHSGPADRPGRDGINCP
jgi:adenylate cyclase